jgi:hypothetical protein
LGVWNENTIASEGLVFEAVILDRMAGYRTNSGDVCAEGSIERKQGCSIPPEIQPRGSLWNSASFAMKAMIRQGLDAERDQSRRSQNATWWADLSAINALGKK